MGKFNEAYYKEQNETITLITYNQENHYNKLYCPECLNAPLHIVEKQKCKYFASNRKEEHNKDCSHFAELVSSKNIGSLIKSKNLEEDKKRLDFLIKSGLNGALKLLEKEMGSGHKTNNSSSNSILSEIVNKTNNITQTTETFKRVHIKNLIPQKEELKNEFIIIYGQANIEIKKPEKRVNSETKEQFTVHQLSFNKGSSSIFSISLYPNQLVTMKMKDNTKEEKKFAIFGQLGISKNNNLYIKLKKVYHLKIKGYIHNIINHEM